MSIVGDVIMSLVGDVISPCFRPLQVGFLPVAGSSL